MPRSTGGRRWSVNSMGAMNRGPDSKVVEAGKVIANESVSAPVLGGHLKGNVTGRADSASALRVSAKEANISLDNEVGGVQVPISRDFSVRNHFGVIAHDTNTLIVENTPPGSIVIIEEEGGVVGKPAKVVIKTTLGNEAASVDVTEGKTHVLLVVDAAGTTINLNNQA